MSIGTLQATKQKAIDQAVHKLTDFVGKEKLTQSIADGLEKQGRDRGLAPQPKAVAAAVPEQPKVESEVATAPAESSLVQAVELKTIRKRNGLPSKAAPARWC